MSFTQKIYKGKERKAILNTEVVGGKKQYSVALFRDNDSLKTTDVQSGYKKLKDARNDAKAWAGK